jgi:hypothetical protein
MSALLIALIIFSLSCLVSIPMIRLWYAPPEKIQEGERSPAMAPY